MTAAVAGIRQRTPEWLDFRRDRITASDAAIIAGETGSVLELWAQKRGLVDPPVFDDATQELMDEGTAIQPYLIDFYRRRTGARVRNVNTVRVSRDWPVAMCSPDGERVGEPIGIEAKMTTAARWPAAYRAGEPVPGDVFAQVQWQAFVAGWERVDVVVLLFGRPKIIEIPRDPAYLEDLLAMARQFHGWVLSGERPPLDGSENARRVLSALHPHNDGTLLEAPPEVEQLVRDIAAAKAEIKGSEGAVGSMENALRALIADADGFAGPWGRVTWKRNADSTRTNWPAVAKAYRALLEALLHDASMGTDAWPAAAMEALAQLDAIQSIHTETVPGPRVLRTSLKETS